MNPFEEMLRAVDHPEEYPEVIEDAPKVKIVGSAVVSAEKGKPDVEPKGPRTGSAAMHEWQLKKEEEEDGREQIAA